MAPTVRSALRTGASIVTACPCSSAISAWAISSRSSTSAIGWACRSAWRIAISGPTSGLWKIRVKSRPFAFQWSIAAFLSRRSELADHLRDGAEAHRGHEFAHLLGDEEEVVDDVLGQSLEALAQHRVLRRDADRAGVEVALAHHDAAGGDQRRGREAELVGAEQRRDDDVAPGAQAAVGLEHDAAAQAVQHEGLLRLGKADLPGRARVLDRGQRRGAGAALEARDGDVVGARLGDARRDRADADLGDELHRHVGGRVDVLQVEDELRQVLDRVDVVVRRRRDQADAGRRMAHARDLGVDLVAGKLAALAGLRALRDLDLHHVGVDEVLGRHAEAAGGDLLDRRALGASRPAAAGSARIPRRPRRCSSLPPMAFMASASVSCASFEIEPKDIAPVEKRFTISRAGSTSSSGTGARPISSAVLIAEQAADGLEARAPARSRAARTRGSGPAR